MSLPQASASTAVYQYSVLEGDRRVYLWVPPVCRTTRGLIVAFKNLTEQRWLEDPIIRAAASDECLGVVWVGEGRQSGLSADMGKGAGAAFLQMQRDLARVSGFPEIANALIIPTGHSAHGQFAWKFAQWAPDRTIAAIAIKTVPLPAGLRLPGVPLFYLVGQTTEWPQFRDARPGDRDYFWRNVRLTALALRKGDPDIEVAVAVSPGGGHFDWCDGDAQTVALYIRRMCELRLLTGSQEPGMPPKPRPIPVASGWLMDSGGMERDRFAAAPVGKYVGPIDEAYWLPDQDMAEAVGRLQGDRKDRAKQMLSFSQDGRVLPVAEEGFAALRFEPAADGVSFQLQAVFLDSVPSRLMGAGAALTHGHMRISLSVTTGPVEQIGPMSFQYAQSRECGVDGWIEEETTGSASFRKAVQPGKIHFPANIEGKEQKISFSPIPAQRVGTRTVKLQATSDSGLPVRFFVVSGPTRVVNKELQIVELPSGGVREVPVIVTAYQEGRPGDGDRKGVRAAESITQTFLLERTSGEVAR